MPIPSMNPAGGEPAEPRTPPILVVDDEVLIVEALQEILLEAGYSVVGRTEPKAALEELQNQQFSVILSDQRMPGISGLELLAHARRLQPDATRILITGVLSLDTVVEAINKGEIFRFIIKPWLREEFLATVRNGVQRHQLLVQNARLQEKTLAMNEQLLDLNRSLERQVALAARQNEQLERSNEALESNSIHSIELCVLTMQTFYPSLGRQARAAFRVCRSMAQVLKLPPAEQRLFETSALLHDLGLVGVPRHVIRGWQENPEQLEPTEDALIRQHPVLSQDMATFATGLDGLGQIIRCHHERVDGCGYPDGLQGDSIPWLGRLLAVAVGYAASRLAASDALEAVSTASGSAFDPDAVRVLLKAQPLASAPCQEREIPISDLRPGMVLASGVYSSHGLLLLPEGQRLNSTAIENIRHHDRRQSLNRSLVVYC
jgi:response regulator RpfG family c-di-GMP phosphodiesterase